MRPLRFLSDTFESGEEQMRLAQALPTRARTAGSSSGQTLVEAMVAIGVFSIIAVAGITLLTGAVLSNGLSRQKSIAEQLGVQEMEKVRQLAYDQVGISGGNPSGSLAASSAIASTVGLSGTITRQVKWVDDPADGTPYVTHADYKRVTITIARSDGKTLSTQTTNVSPFDAQSYGGPNVGTLNVTVQDMGNQTALPGASVSISNGPSGAATDTSDAAGLASFPSLLANPSSGSTKCYEISVTPPAGYVVYPPDAPNACGGSPSDAVIAAGQTTAATIRVYKPASVVFNVTRYGAPYATSTSVQLSATLPGDANPTKYNYTVTGGTLSVPANLAAAIPTFVTGSGLTYTATATSGSGAGKLTAMTVSLPIPDAGYPATSTQTFPIAFPDTTVTVKDKTSSLNCVVDKNATVTVTGGPNGVNVSQATNSGGQAQFDLLPGSGYSVSVTSSLGTATPLTNQTVVASPGLTAWKMTAFANGKTGACP